MEYAVAATLSEAKDRKPNKQLVACKICGTLVESGGATPYNIQGDQGLFRCRFFLCSDCHIWAQIIHAQWCLFRDEKKVKEQIAYDRRLSKLEGMISKGAKPLRNGEASKLLDIAPNHLSYWRKKGMGPRYTKVHPRVFLYEVEDLRNWMVEKKTREREKGNNHG
jgi:hypothetical protein